MIFYNRENEAIQLITIPLGSGGEGNIYQIETIKYRHFVAKIYHLRSNTEEKQAKLEYILANKPLLENDYTVIWAEDLLFDSNGNFAGFLMKMAQGSFDLTSLAGLYLSNKMGGEWEQKFGRNSIQGFKNRIKLCYNIAAAIQQIHASKKYVLVDLKPENIKINLSGQVNIIDIDSMQIQNENNELLFPAEKLTGEYSPAESQNLDFKTEIIPETWDRFSLGVVFYKILFGLHPFAGTGKAEYNNLVSHTQKIQAGLFPNGVNRSNFEVIPKPHENFKVLSEDAQLLFLKCFDKGFLNPELRPSPKEWCQVWENMSLNTEYYNSPYEKTIPQKVANTSSNNPQKSNTAYSRKYKPMNVGRFVLILSGIYLGFILLWNLISQTKYNTNDMENIVQEPTRNFGDPPAYYEYEYEPEYEEDSTVIAQRKQEDLKILLEQREIQRKKVIPANLEKINKPYGGDYKYGYQHKYTGAIIIPIIYDDISEFKYERAIVKKDNLYGIIDFHHNFTTPLEYKKIVRVDNERGFGYYVYGDDGAFILLDSKGDINYTF